MPPSSALASLAGPALRLQTDARLVTLSRDGHDRAFEEIVRRYRPALVSFAGSIVPGDRAEDVVQEAFERAHRAITSSDAELALRPWLYRVVRNGALNNLRDHRSHEELDPEYDGVPQPPDIAARSAELAATVAAINALPAGQREAIVKRELEGRGHEEIATDLGVSPGAVRQLIFRARTTLRDGLGALIPLPVMRSLLEAGSAGTGAAGGAAALGVAGGAGGMALKTGAAVVIAGLAIGSGVALRGDRGHSPELASAAPRAHAGGSARGGHASSGAGAESHRSTNSHAGSDAGRAEGGRGDGRAGEGGGGRAGPGGGDQPDGEGQPVPGGGDGGGNSGSGGDDALGDDGDTGPDGSEESPDDGGDDAAEDPQDPPEPELDDEEVSRDLGDGLDG